MTSSALLTYDLELQCKVNSILTRKKTTHQSQKIYYAIIYQVSVFVKRGNSYNWNVVIFGSNHELPLLMIIFMRIEIVTKFFSQNLILQINVGPVSRNLRLSYIFKEIQIILRLFLVIAMYCQAKINQSHNLLHCQLEGKEAQVHVVGTNSLETTYYLNFLGYIFRPAML